MGEGRTSRSLCLRKLRINQKGTDWENAILVMDDHDSDDDIVLADDLKRKKAENDEPPSTSGTSSRKRKRSFSGHPVVDEIEIEEEPSFGGGGPMSSCCFCPICLEPKFLSFSVGMSGCPHRFCSDCVRQYVAVKVEENATGIGCPSPGCKDGFLEPARCGYFLQSEVFERWCGTLCESLALGPTCFYCPFKDCSAPLMDETHGGSNGEAIKESECPHCWRLFCAQCKVPWHAELSCEEFQKLAADERGQEDIKLMELADENKWQRCSNCKFFVERSEGCKFITCRCGHTFCYTCGAKMTVDHYCTVCKA